MIRSRGAMITMLALASTLASCPGRLGMRSWSFVKRGLTPRSEKPEFDG
jgi:hypothetical protein